ncbi:hypothetical protein NMB33_21550 [Burkholderia sp. FXe9]|nr:hypothetical protein NMB33_21550 [Burkholderia sp. FXe9]
MLATGCRLRPVGAAYRLQHRVEAAAGGGTLGIDRVDRAGQLGAAKYPAAVADDPVDRLIAPVAQRAKQCMLAIELAQPLEVVADAGRVQRVGIERTGARDGLRQ